MQEYSVFSEKKCKAIVLACNTLTTISLNFLRTRFPFVCFVGIVPPIKPAVLQSKTGHIVIFSTQATKKSQYLQDLMKHFAPNKKIYNVCAPGLVEIIEKGQIKGKKINKLLKKSLKQALKDSKVDVVVAGCTHYYFIKQAILGVFPQKVKFMEATLPVALQIKRILEKNNLFSYRRRFLRFLTTGYSISFEKTFKNLCGFQIQAKEVKL